MPADKSRIGCLGEAPVVVLKGDIDAASNGRLGDLTDVMIERGNVNVEVKMDSVDFLSLSTISALLGCAGRLQKAGGTLKISGASETLRGVLKNLNISEQIGFTLANGN